MLILRLLTRRFGEVSPGMQAQIQALSIFSARIVGRSVP
jgi:hypothetical protein